MSLKIETNKKRKNEESDDIKHETMIAEVYEVLHIFFSTVHLT